MLAFATPNPQLVPTSMLCPGTAETIVFGLVCRQGADAVEARIVFLTVTAGTSWVKMSAPPAVPELEAKVLLSIVTALLVPIARPPPVPAAAELPLSVLFVITLGPATTPALKTPAPFDGPPPALMVFPEIVLRRMLIAPSA
jgi:hypothetical protein